MQLTDHDQEVQMSPRMLARIGGAFYLMIIVGGTFGEAFIRGRAIVPGDASATAQNIMSSQLLWRLGMASEMVMLGLAVVLALILYILLRPVNKDVALLAVLFNMLCIAVEATNELNLLTALFPLTNADYMKAFDPQQLHALASLSMKSYAHGFGIGLILFGCECLVLGYLIYRSRFLPKPIGVLMVLAGVSYLINSFALIISPPLASRLFPVILLPALVGELSLCLWLLVKGVDVDKWNAWTNAKPGRTDGLG